MLARDVMTTDVATVRPGTPIKEAICKMVELRISGLPVLEDDGRLVGILTEGDLLRRHELGTVPHRPSWLNFLRGPGLAAADYVRTHTLHVSDVMTPAPVTVEPTAALDSVVSLMTRQRIKRVPIVENNKLVGIVSRSDLVRALAALIAGPCTVKRDDEAIRAGILTELEHHNWSSLSNIAITVDAGHVKLEGIAQTEIIRSAIRVAAENTSGVSAVEDAMAVPDPMVMAIGA
jgi:CBS domain-containing protein